MNLRLLCVGLGGMLVLSTGCADDLYAPCDLDPSVPDPAVSACGATDDSERSCVVDNYLGCDTRTCGRFQGSEPFCTATCTTDDDCPAGRCREFVFQTGEFYCVEEARL